MHEISRDGIQQMFDRISPTYDRANRWMTFGRDRNWRKQMRKYLPLGEISLLDLATGTGDQILSLIDCVDTAVGIDLSEDMLAIGKQKCAAHQNVEMRVGSALDVPFEDQSFDAVTMTFGIRNVTDTDLALREMVRVLKPGGRAIIIEGGLVENRFLRKAHLFYLRHILPRLGGVISGHPDAYAYLNKTIETYPYGAAFLEKMRQAGFVDLNHESFMFGSVHLYVGSSSVA